MPLQEQMWICQTKQVPCQMCSLMVGSNYYFIKKKKNGWKQLMMEKISLMTIKTDRLKYFTNRNNHDNKDNSPEFWNKSNANNYNFLT